MDYKNKNQLITDSVDHELIEYWKKLKHKPTVIICKNFLFFIIQVEKFQIEFYF